MATEYQDLARKAVALVKAIHTMRASPEHKHVFELYAAHRFTYTGPDVIAEMIALIETIGQHRAGA